MADAPSRARISPTTQILIGLVLGILIGFAVNTYHPEWAPVFKPFSTIFLHLIKMIIAPLIFCSLVAGIAGAGHGKAVGRMGFRAIVYFELVTTLALVVGLVVVSITQPGVGVQLKSAGEEQLQQVSSILGSKTKPPQTWDEILVHTFPTSVVQAMAEGDVLQVVVFSIFFGIGLAMLKERGKPVVQVCELVTETMFKVTGVIMLYAPVGVSAAIAYTVGHSGGKVLWNLAQLVGTLYLALAVFIALVLVPVALFFKVPLRSFARMVREPAVIAFSTASSEAALSTAMQRLERFGVPKPIVAFILPLGYSFNLDGSTLYMSLGAMFVAQAAGIQLSIGQQVSMVLMLMLTSKGIAAVPRASLMILAGALSTYHLPMEGLALILGVDTLMDMARTMVNLVGNCLATVLVAKWEGQFDAAAASSFTEEPAPAELGAGIAAG